ncbi:MAG: hypothetical protein ACRERE_23475 [Candidatus Entotheonellia bacterium]
MSYPSNNRLVDLLRQVPAERLRSLYARHGVDPAAGPGELVREICLDGANTIASLFRGRKGVPYIDLVRDVAEKMGVKDDIFIRRNERKIELAVLESVIRQYLAKATEAEREEIHRILKEVAQDHQEVWRHFLIGGGALTMLLAQLGPKVVTEVVQRIVASIIGRQLTLGALKGGAGIVGLAVPLLNVAMIGWTIVDLAGPAFRKTIPTVIEIALLRLEFEGQAVIGESAHD